jgi:metal-sulfur cluster biosynthetic enzyme
MTNNEEKYALASEELKYVIDPEIGLNVVDLGLIYEINFDEENKKVDCTMTLTTQFCPMGESIKDGVTQALEATFPGYGIDVNLTFDPPWSYSLISDEGKEFLNM